MMDADEDSLGISKKSVLTVDKFHTYLVFWVILLLFLLLTSVWIEWTLKHKPWKSIKQSSSLKHCLRSCSNSGSWYGVLPGVAVTCSHDVFTQEEMVELSMLCLLMISSYLFIVWSLHNQYGGHLLTLTLFALDLTVLGFILIAQGLAGLLSGVIIQCICLTVFYQCIFGAKGCFTVGEGMIVAQLTTVFLHRVISLLYHSIHIRPIELSLNSQVKWFAAIVFLSVTTVIVALLLLLHFCQKIGAVLFYTILFSILVFIGLPALSYGLHRNPVVWLLLYLVEDSNRFRLFVSWVMFTLIAVVVVLYQGSEATTLTRKYFHYLVVAVYAPGLLLDTQFLSLAAVIALAVLILLEAIRVLNIPPLGTVVHDLFKGFCDEKDNGPIIVSHIYLLLGLSLPVWLPFSSNVTQGNSLDISLFSGVIALGVGDTAASIGGTMFGRTRWPGTKKTLEGTGISVFSQLLAVLVLSYFGMVISHSLVSVVVIVTVTSVLEGLTSQIDNLILPLMMFTLFRVTYLVSQYDTVIL